MSDLNELVREMAALLDGADYDEPLSDVSNELWRFLCELQQIAARATAPTLTGDGGDGESACAQIDRLSTFILQNVPGEPSQNQGAVDTAIRLIDASLAAQHGEGSANVS